MQPPSTKNGHLWQFGNIDITLHEAPALLKCIPGVTPAHVLEHLGAPALRRQVELPAHVGPLRDEGENLVGKVLRVRRRETDPDLGKFFDMYMEKTDLF